VADLPTIPITRTDAPWRTVLPFESTGVERSERGIGLGSVARASSESWSTFDPDRALAT